MMLVKISESFYLKKILTRMSIFYDNETVQPTRYCKKVGTSSTLFFLLTVCGKYNMIPTLFLHTYDLFI